MTMQITPARPSLAMYGKSLAETVAIKDWAMRRIDKTALPASSFHGLGAPGQRRDLKKWGVNPIGETVAVKDWAMRRIDKAAIPHSSLMGLGDPRRWGINPIGETTFVNNMETRRYGKTPPPGSDQMDQGDVMVQGFGAFGVTDTNVPVREAQTIARKLGYCLGSDGRPLAIDNVMGPNTRAVLTTIAALPAYRLPPEQAFSAPDGATTLAVNTAWWASLNATAEGRVDSCRSGGGGGSTSTPSPSPAPSPDSGGSMASDGGLLSSPWTWLAIAVLVGGGAYAYMSSDTESPDDAVSIRF